MKDKEKCKYFKEIDYGYRQSKQCYAQKCAPEVYCDGNIDKCSKYPTITEEIKQEEKQMFENVKVRSYKKSKEILNALEQDKRDFEDVKPNIDNSKEKEIIKKVFDNEKQIEEIVKSCKNCIHNAVCDKKIDLKYYFDNHDCEHYQPKIPENAFILTDDNAEELANLIITSPQMQSVMSDLIKAWQKETAEKFARDIFKHITTLEVWEVLQHNTWLSSGGNFVANRHIYDLLIEPVATKFGVDIKE